MSNNGPSAGVAPGDANERTISTYDRYAQRYIDRTTHELPDPLRQWLDRAVAGLPRDVRILEIGSGFGRDAGYLNGLGYRVRCTDAAPAFVAELRARGIDADPLNAITDELPGALDVLLANSVLLHFTREQFSDVAAKARRSLRPGGRFAFIVRLGDGQEWSNGKMDAPRFFCYWREPQLRDVLFAAGFVDIDIRRAPGPGDKLDQLQVVAEP